MLIVVAFLTIYGVVRTRYDVEPLSDTLSTGQVQYRDRERRVVVKSQNQRYYLYYDHATQLRPGDWIAFNGQQAVINAPLNIGDFNYQRLLHARRISGVIYAESVVVYDSQFHVYQFRDGVSRYIDRYFQYTRGYLRMFILAETEAMDQSIRDQASSLGIAHLFAISGLHIGLIALALETVLKRVKLSPKLTLAITSIVLILVMILTSFTPSVVRAGGLYTLLRLNKLLKLEFTAFDLTALTAVLLLFFQPFYYYRVGFLLTYIISMGLLLNQTYLRQGNRFKQLFKVSTLAFLFSLPIVSGFNYSVNPLTIVFNVVFVGYTMFLLLPGVYLSFFLPFLEPLLRVISGFFETLVELTYTTFNWPVRLYFDHSIKIFGYYLILGFVFNRFNYRRLSILVLYVTLIYSTPYLNLYPRMVFFHVEGDSALIQDRFNRCTLLIDTGDIDPYQSLNHHLHRLHVTTIDYVIISHFHQDHYGGYADLSSAFLIEHTITNLNQESYENRWIPCGALHFFIFPLEFPHRSENNRSIVMKIRIQDETILFVGDAEIERERTLLVYDLSADFLKIGHHGSNTSSHDFFLDHVNPRDALVPTYQNNPFNHPSDAVIARLTNRPIVVHRVDQEGMIIFQYRLKERIKRTPFSP